MVHDFKKYPELRNSQLQIYYLDSPHRQIIENFTAKVIKVIDGDTIKVKWEDRDFNFPIRMAFIAAPEIKEEGGKRSQQWLEKQILGKDVDILIDPYNRVGKWGRLIGQIMFMGQNLNQASLDFGYSTVFGKEDSTKWEVEI